MLVWIEQRIKKPYAWVLLIACLNFIKELWVKKGMEVSYLNIGILMTSFIFYLACYGMVLLFPKKVRLRSFLWLYSFLTLLLFADLVHSRYFHAPLSVYTFVAAGQVMAVKDSVKVLLRGKDILLFADIIVLWIVSLRKNPISIELPKVNRLISAGVAILLFITLVTGSHYRGSNGLYTAERLGLMNYHLYELVETVGGGNKNSAEYQKYLLERTMSQKPIEDRKAYGAAQGRNVFVIQVEAMQDFVINAEINGQPITPVMNELINRDSFYVSNYYQQLGRGNTSDAEFVTHNSLYPSMRGYTYKEYERNEFYTLPIALKEQRYSTIAFHGNEPDFWNRKNIYPSLGLDTFISEDELNMDEIISMGLSDGSLFKQSVAYLKELPQPVYGFYVTLSTHHPFKIPQELKGLEVKGEFEGTMLGNYLESMNYFDRVLGEFIEDLKEAGLYENSIIAIYGDHFGIDIRDEAIKAQASAFIGREYDLDDVMRVGLILHIPGYGEAEKIEVSGGQIDFFPTMLNLLGIESKTTTLFGQDLINAEKGFSAHQTIMVKGSFIDDEIAFEMSRDGKFENSRAWNIQTRETVPVEKYRDGYERAIRDIGLSAYLLDANLSKNNNWDLDKDMEIIFTDIIEHWAEEPIKYMVEKGAISGYLDGRFHPEDTIKRGELIKILAFLRNWKDIEGNSFNDTYDHWASPYIEAAVKQNVLDKDLYGDNFNPDEPAEVGEAIRWMADAYKLKVVNDNYEGYFKEKGILEGLESLMEKDLEPMDRATAMVLLYRLINL